MVYNPSIPTAPDFLSVSQPQILENFSQANTIFAANHVAFDDATALNRGKHTYVTMLDNSGSPLTALDEGAIYVDNSGGTRQYAYYKRENAAAGAGIEIPFSMMGGFGCVDSTGALVGSSFNITSVRTASGRFTISITNPMIDANYAVLVSIQVNDAASVWTYSVGSKAANSFTIKVKTLADAFFDPNSMSILILGEIA